MSKFLASTALAVVMGLGVATPVFADAHLKNIASYQQEQEGDIYASELIGMRVYATEKEDYDGWNADTRMADGAEKEWDDIGEVNDVILGSNGEVKAVVLGIGGFIGIGEKDVAVAMSDIKMVREEGDSDDFFLVVKTNKQMLTDVEPFQRMSMSENVETTTENAAAATENATENAAEATENAAEATGEAVENAAEATGEAAENAAEATENATENAAAATENAVEGDNTVVTTTAPVAAERTMLRQPAEREIEGYRAAEMEELTTETLTGARVYGSNDEDIGEVDKLILDDSGKITKAVLDIGGFLGLGEHEIAVTMDELRIVRTDGGDDFRVYVDATQEELEAQPEYND